MLSSVFRLYLGKHISESNLRTFSLCSLQLGHEKSEKPPGDGHRKKEASQKLHSLLQSIIKDDLTGSKTSKDSPKIEIPKPRSVHQKMKIARKEETKQTTTLGQKIVEAAQEVSKTIEGSRTETEAQLLQKLLYKESTLKDEIVKAAPKSLNLSDILSELKIEKEEVSDARRMEKGTWSDTGKSLSKDKRPFRAPRDHTKIGKSVARVNIFGGKPLGIFKAENVREESQDLKLTTWDQCYEHELRLSSTQPPINIYEQMIQWTDRGILWKFPIDNEQGMEEEKQVDFSEHVFLEPYLEDWCPDKGPVRHFMELVCVGLSRNHWLTAREKKEHMLWYKEFFTSKKALLKQVGAGQITDTQVALQQ